MNVGSCRAQIVSGSEMLTIPWTVRGEPKTSLTACVRGASDDIQLGSSEWWIWDGILFYYLLTRLTPGLSNNLSVTALLTLSWQLCLVLSWMTTQDIWSTLYVRRHSRIGFPGANTNFSHHSSCLGLFNDAWTVGLCVLQDYKTLLRDLWPGMKSWGANTNFRTFNRDVTSLLWP